MPSSSAAAVGLSVEAVFLLAIPLNQPFCGGEGVTRTTVFEFYDSHAGACRLVAKRALWFGISPALLSQRGRKPDQWKRVQGMWVAMISTMWTARPTTGSPFSFSEAGTAPFDPASSCFCLFGRLDPANPFVARQTRNVLRRLERLDVGGQCPFQGPRAGHGPRRLRSFLRPELRS